MKAKYRLGELIEFNGEHKVVTGVIRRAAGFSYEVGEAEVTEDQVTNVYRPRTTRTIAKKTKTQKTSRAAKTTAQDAVTQQ